MELHPTEILELTLPHCTKTKIDKTLTQQEIRRIESSMHYFYCSLRWFVKLEYPRHSLKDMPMAYRKNCKLHGQYLQQIFNLCINTHGRQFSNKIPEYKNASEWFLIILKESIDYRIIECVTPLDIPKIIHNGKQKDRLISEYSKELRELRNYKNPYRNSPYSEHLAYLFDCAFELAQQSDNFKKEYFLPIIRTGREIISSYQSPTWQRLYIDDEGRLCLNRSGNKSKIVLA